MFRAAPGVFLLGLAALVCGCAGRTFDNLVDPNNSSEVQIIRKFDASRTRVLQPAGMDFVREELWVVDLRDTNLHQLSATDGSSQAVRNLGELRLGPIFDVAYDGTLYWVTQTGGTMSRIDPFRFEAVRRDVPTGGGDPRGIAFHDSFLWVIDGSRSIFKIDPANATVAETIPVPTIENPGGLTFRGDELWAIDRQTNRLVRLALDGAEIVDYELPGGGAVGLTAEDGGRGFYFSDQSGNIFLIEPFADEEE